MVVNSVACDADGQQSCAASPWTRSSESCVTATTSSGSGLHEPDEALLEKLQEEFGLHDLAIEDARTMRTSAPRSRATANPLFIVVHHAQMVAGKIEFGETHIFLGRNYLVTVRHGASLSLPAGAAQLRAEPELMALGPSYGLYSVLDFRRRQFLPHRARVPRRADRAGAGHLPRRFKARHAAAPVRPEEDLVEMRLAISAAAGHPQPAHALPIPA